MFEDDDLDISSGSDFGDDEDPDKIEVPGKSIAISLRFLHLISNCSLLLFRAYANLIYQVVAVI